MCQESWFADKTSRRARRHLLCAYRAGCDIARTLVEYARRLRPHYPIELINLNQDGVVQPPYVFGTPTYCLEDEIISLGDPSAQALLAALDNPPPAPYASDVWRSAHKP
jgi:hypothetical protein